MTQAATALAHAHHCTLVVIDMQTRTLATMQATQVASMCQIIARTLQVAQRLAVPIVYTEHEAPPQGVIDPRVANALPDSAFAVRKKVFCAWADDSFANAIEIAARRQVVICGVQAHIGVLQTAITLAEHDYSVFVVEDGIGSRDSALTTNALQRMRASGVSVISSESLVHEWLEDGDPSARDEVLAILQET